MEHVHAATAPQADRGGADEEGEAEQLRPEAEVVAAVEHPCRRPLARTRRPGANRRVHGGGVQA
ncbi:MAG: hypothetical protein ACRDN6_01645 [Gaiellaceae bacterium]